MIDSSVFLFNFRLFQSLYLFSSFSFQCSSFSYMPRANLDFRPADPQIWIVHLDLQRP